MGRTPLVGGPKDGRVVSASGAFFVRDGEVYRWKAEWERYVYQAFARVCLNCGAIVEVPSDEVCPLCGYTDGDVWEDAG